MKATIQNELCHTAEWEADLLKVVSTAAKLGMHCGVNESVTKKKPCSFVIHNLFPAESKRENQELQLYSSIAEGENTLSCKCYRCLIFSVHLCALKTAIYCCKSNKIDLKSQKYFPRSLAEVKVWQRKELKNFNAFTFIVLSKITT